MDYNKSFITYAVSLHFSQDVNEIIFNTMSSIAELTGNDFMIENKVPPHITIGAFHGTKDSEEHLMQIVEEFTKAQKSAIQSGAVKQYYFRVVGHINDAIGD